MRWTIRGSALLGAGLAVAMLSPALAPAQQPLCYPYRVQAQFINVAREPDDQSVLIDVLEGGDMACIKSERPIGGRQWGYVVFKMRPEPGERSAVDGWAPMKYLKPMHAAKSPPGEGASPAADPLTDDAVVSVQTLEDAVKFDQPIPFGPVPIRGSTLQDLIDGVPLFPPIKEIEASSWQKNCSNCHKWDQPALCKQGAIYLADPKAALRQPHPYGAPFKVALMRWSKNGCQ